MKIHSTQLKNLQQVFLMIGLCFFANAKEPVPNIIIFMADDMGMGDSSAYQQFTKNKDSEQIYTPAMERLAETGVLFTDGHSAAAVCHPSRVGLMRGGRPVDYHLPLGPTMPEMLQRAGYRTYGIGKWHVRFEAGEDYHADTPIKECALDYGFHHYTGTEHNTQHSPAFHIDRSYQVYDGKTKRLLPNPYKTAPGYEQPGGTFVEVQTQLWMHTFRAYLANHTKEGELKDQPFFLYYASHANHGEFKPAREVDGIKIIGGSKTVDQKPILKDKYGMLRAREEMIWENDVAVSRIFSWLSDTDDPRNPGKKMIENTLFIFTSDNGANSGLGSSESYVKKMLKRKTKSGAGNKLDKKKKLVGQNKLRQGNTPPNGLFKG
ncbi:MAG: sulfatase-like hydrolase/transferase, partial [Lentisphaeraceae bacterium]|nr:sulfatase-like hydrolase/transferase [Lentisphaeraceae bacterium]